MAITDGIIYRLKPEAGDVAPHNEIGGGHILSGGTITLVDRGSGDLAWQFAGGEASVAGPAATYAPTAAAGGLTMLVTLKVVTNPTTDFTRYAQIQKVGDTNTYLGFTQNGANSVRSRLNSSSGAGSSFSGIGATETTLVVRIKTNGAGVEVVDTWKRAVGRSGTTPDGTQSFAAGTSTLATLSNLLCGGGASSVVQIKDWVIWQAEPTDAECSALADDARGTLDAAAGTSVSSDLAATYGVSAYTSASLAASYAISSAMTSVSSSLAAAYGVTAYVGASIAASYSVAGTPASGSFVTDKWINNTGTPRGAIAVSYTWVSLGRIGSLTGKTLTEGTATLSAGSILTATGLPLGAGFLLGAVLGSDATTDDVYYEAGTVA